jgi:LmbE family N-acetylglucosaminyl deacetylase
VAVYHAMPHGLRDGLRRRILAGAFVNTTSVQAVKRQALASHQSQQRWLQRSQAMNSFMAVMEEMSLEVGKMSRRFQHAEGWRRHSHLGFGAAGADPLGRALGRNFLVNQNYERNLEKGY